jgi:hypothetical protein
MNPNKKAVSVYLTEDFLARVQNYCTETSKSVSKVLCDLIYAGVKHNPELLTKQPGIEESAARLQERNKTGPKSKYPEPLCQQVDQMCRQGMNVWKIANALGIDAVVVGKIERYNERKSNQVWTN